MSNRKSRSARISTLGSRLTSVISVTLVLIILGALAITLVAARSLSRQVKSNMGFILKMEAESPVPAIDALKRKIAAEPYVDRFVYSSPDAILAEESEAMGENLAELIDRNPYGAEFDVKVRPQWADADSISALAARLELMDGVEEVVTETAVITSVNYILHRLSWCLLAVAAALLVISFVLINNTVSLAVYSRRFIIYTMRLVGATGAYIRAPFMRAGAWTGLVAGLIAAGLLSLLLVYLDGLDPSVATIVPWSQAAWILAGVMALGVIICLGASALATNRYLRSGYDDMFMK